jgi:hypothetical protein
MKTTDRLTILVSSTVYGVEELLDRVYVVLTQYGYDVWMSHKGTMPVLPDRSNFENCLAAVEACGLFLGIGVTERQARRDLTELEDANLLERVGAGATTNRTWMAGTARVADLCCGMGGLSVAAREMGMRVVAGVDVNPSALRTFSRNFPEAEAIEGSVRSRTVVDRCRMLLSGDGDGVSVVLSGPPCQGFSAARRGIRRTGGMGVLVAVVRAIAKLHPDCAMTVVNRADAEGHAG